MKIPPKKLLSNTFFNRMKNHGKHDTPSVSHPKTGISIEKANNSASLGQSPDEFERVHFGGEEIPERERFVSVFDLDLQFSETPIRPGGSNTEIPSDLIPQNLMSKAAIVFADYSGVRIDEKKIQSGLWSAVKQSIRQQISNRLKAKDEIIDKAFESVEPSQIITFALGLAIHAAQNFNAQDAVDFMLLLSEKVSDKSTFYRANYPTYNRFAVEAEEKTGDANQFAEPFDDRERKINIYAITSVRGRLAALALAQAEEMNRNSFLEKASSELVESSKDMARKNCQLLFSKPWCAFDREYYRSI